jgi:hypothetical protein
MQSMESGLPSDDRCRFTPKSLVVLMVNSGTDRRTVKQFLEGFLSTILAAPFKLLLRTVLVDLGAFKDLLVNVVFGPTEVV